MTGFTLDEGRMSREMKRASTQVMECIERGFEDMCDDVAATSQRLAPTGATLGLKDSLNTDYSSSDVKIVEYEAPYAAFVEYGTGPHPVSQEGIENLERWAHIKLGLPPQEARSAAHAIAWKIRKKGTSPQPFLRPAIDAHTQNISQYIEKRLRSAR